MPAPQWQVLPCEVEPKLSAHKVMSLEVISGAKISAQVPGPVGGIMATCAMPVPAMVSPAASAVAASATASFLKRCCTCHQSLTLRG